VCAQDEQFVRPFGPGAAATLAGATARAVSVKPDAAATQTRRRFMINLRR